MSYEGERLRRLADSIAAALPEAQRHLADFAGLTADERHALDQWCYDQEAERARGVLLYEAEPRREGKG